MASPAAQAVIETVAGDGIVTLAQGMTHKLEVSCDPVTTAGVVTSSLIRVQVDDAATLAILERMQPGDVVYGYVQARPPFLEILTRPGRATIFV